MGDTTHARIDVVGAASGQEVLNTLWYRMEETGTDNAAVAAALAAEWVATVAPQWVKFFPSQYVLNRIEVQTYSSLWAQLLFLPHVAQVGTPGVVSGSLAGPAQTIILAFQLDLGSLLQPSQTTPPRRSYLALGPVPEAGISDLGQMVSSFWASGDLLNFRGAVVAELTDPPLFGLADPERVGKPNDVGQRASMLVTETAFRLQSSFRRSRNN